MSNTQRVEGHTPTLKACPFCGSPAVDEVDYGEEPNFYIHCSNKDCCIWDCGTTLESWNTRSPSIERLEKVNETLVRALEPFAKFACADGWAAMGCSCHNCNAARAVALAKEPA